MPVPARPVATVALALAGWVAGTGQGSAQGAVRLALPSEVVLYVQADLESTAFVDPLVCALERVLVAPVSVRPSAVPIGRDLLLTATQVDVEAVAARFRDASAADGRGPVFRHLLVRQDITVKGYTYMFASRFGGPGSADQLQVVSTARLSPPAPAGKADRETDLLVQRLYKIILRGIAHNAGVPSTGCVLAFGNSLAEHDAKPSRFCEGDRARLVAAGFLRVEERSTCAPLISRRGEPAGSAA